MPAGRAKTIKARKHPRTSTASTLRQTVNSKWSAGSLPAWRRTTVARSMLRPAIRETICTSWLSLEGISVRMGRPAGFRSTNWRPTSRETVPTSAPSALSSWSPEVTTTRTLPMLCSEICTRRSRPGASARPSAALSSGTPESPSTSTSNSGSARGSRGTASLVLAVSMTRLGKIIGSSLGSSKTAREDSGLAKGLKEATSREMFLLGNGGHFCSRPCAGPLASAGLPARHLSRQAVICSSAPNGYCEVRT
mmetsp:Transcript_86846/g.246206  ORF Transcript_86846/g.246206 Transcript_86846/m.246206 type:complete len:251 (+) Transcript_86846:157-909(+)